MKPRRGYETRRRFCATWRVAHPPAHTRIHKRQSVALHGHAEIAAEHRPRGEAQTRCLTMMMTTTNTATKRTR